MSFMQNWKRNWWIIWRYFLAHAECTTSHCRQRNIGFIAKRAKWCGSGRLIDADGYQLDPLNCEAIQNMEFVKTADELSQCLHCCRWMSSYTPSILQKMEPVRIILDKGYKPEGKEWSRAWTTPQHSEFYGAEFMACPLQMYKKLSEGPLYYLN